MRIATVFHMPNYRLGSDKLTGAHFFHAVCNSLQGGVAPILASQSTICSLSVASKECARPLITGPTAELLVTKNTWRNNTNHHNMI